MLRMRLVGPDMLVFVLRLRRISLLFLVYGWQIVEYENLDSPCLQCGRVRHLQEQCPNGHPNVHVARVSDPPPKDQSPICTNHNDHADADTNKD